MLVLIKTSFHPPPHMATLEDLTINRIIAHEVVLASALNRNQEPLMSSRVSQLDQAGLQLVARRVAEALGMDMPNVCLATLGARAFIVALVRNFRFAITEG